MNTLEFQVFSAADGDAYRRLARGWAASVTVVTVLRRPETVAPGAPLHDGFTATGFLTVSIDPPIVLVSATNASSAFEMLRDAAAFAVNLLSAAQQPVADRFAQPHERRLDAFADLASHRDADGVTLIPGALGAFSARPRQLVPAGDHTLCLGDVTALHLGAAAEPLVYVNRAYGRVTSAR